MVNSKQDASVHYSLKEVAKNWSQK